MKVVKNINNNVSICIDDAGNEVVAFGKGLGFVKPPQIIDESSVEKFFYNMDSISLTILKEIPESIIHTAITIVEYLKVELGLDFMQITVLSLADHLNFSIERQKKQIVLDSQKDGNEIYLYPDILARIPTILKIIKEDTGYDIDENSQEAVLITLHLINSLTTSNSDQVILANRFLDRCISIINKEMGSEIEKNSYNYSRFLSHFKYLVTRSKREQLFDDGHSALYETLKEKFYPTTNSVDKISMVFLEKFDVELSDDERLYLALHINRNWLSQKNKKGGEVS